jgi:hypothetical protein
MLKVGDRVRLVEYPPEFLRPGIYMHRDTVRVYKRLVARRRSLRVAWIDEDGGPWIECRFRRKNGKWEQHFLLLNHRGLARVKCRTN